VDGGIGVGAATRLSDLTARGSMIHSGNRRLRSICEHVESGMLVCLKPQSRDAYLQNRTCSKSSARLYH
jgi:hypothetical protein